jgi:hypothetical protein
MATGTSHHGSRRHIRHLRRAAIGIVVAAATMGVAAIPASAASQDGTSNTIQFSKAAAPRYTIILENTLISGLIEEDGTYPPAP